MSGRDAGLATREPLWQFQTGNALHTSAADR